MQIRQRYPATIQLAFGAMIVALLVAFPLGIISAIHRNSWIDNVARFFALIGVSMPSFWFGPLLIIAFAINHPWLPVSGRDEGLKSLVLPSLIGHRMVVLRLGLRLHHVLGLPASVTPVPL